MHIWKDFRDFAFKGNVVDLAIGVITRIEKLHPHEPTNRDCPACLEKVAYHAKRCKYCTSELPALT